MPKTYRPGQCVTFVAQRATTLHGSRYLKGNEVTIRLTRPWNESEGQGEGGPWGWGGYTARTLSRIGKVER